MRLKVEIDKNGNVQVSVQGVKGNKCIKITKELEEALGAVVERRKTAEYFENEVQQSQKVYMENKQ